MVALVTNGGLLIERARYFSYGVSLGIALGDCDGDMDSGDQSILLGAWGMVVRRRTSESHRDQYARR